MTTITLGNETIKAIARQLADKIRSYQITRHDEQIFNDNPYYNHYYSEYRGMCRMLKTIGVEYNFEYEEIDGELLKTAVIVNGIKVLV